MRRLHLALVVAALGAACSAPAAMATFPGENGKLAFYSDRDDSPGGEVDFNVFTVNPDGTAETRLTDWAFADYFARWNPAGNRIAFSRRQAFGSTAQLTDDVLTLIPGSSAAPTKVTTGFSTIPPDAVHPTWSPDGSKIAFLRRRAVATGDEIWTANADGSGLEILRPSDGLGIGGLDWSPDGTRFVLAGIRPGPSPQWDLYTLAPDGTDLTNITNNPGSADGNPSWSPDGQQIVFTRGPLADSEIYRIKPSGTGLTKLTAKGAAVYAPVWSPDATRIAFASQRSGNWDIYTMNANGSDEMRVTTDPGMDLYPDWQAKNLPPQLTNVLVGPTVLRFTTSEPTATSIFISEIRPGRRVSRSGRVRCVAPGRGTVRSADRCGRAVQLARLDRPAISGENRVPLRTVLGSRTLRSGCYSVRITARDHGGPETRSRTQRFRRNVNASSCP